MLKNEIGKPLSRSCNILKLRCVSSMQQG